MNKSCLYFRWKEDDYIEEHPSGISNQDFVGQVVNNENFLYWGHIKKESDNFLYGLGIIEHTQFYDDTSFKPFGSSELYIKRAAKTKISTLGIKYQYVNIDQEVGDDLEKFPSEKVSVDVFIFVFDVSRDDVYFVDQYNLLESFLKKRPDKPMVLALSKYDSLSCKPLEAIRNLASRGKVPVVEVSASENINVELLFEVAAKLAKHGAKSVLKQTLPTYDNCRSTLQQTRNRISRLYNSLTEQSVVDRNVTWFEFRQFVKDNKNFQNYCELYGTNKAKSNLDRHIRNLTIKFIEKRKNVYLKDMHSVFSQFIDSLAQSDFDNAIQCIRNHPNFCEYFVELPESKSWKDSEILHSTSGRILVPIDILQEPEAIICFEQVQTVY